MNFPLNGELSTELLKYIPIATVACFEAFFRSAVKEIIDFGKPFSSNIANLGQAKNVKLDFEILAAIQTKTLTLGELVGHILPCNNVADINSSLSLLIGMNFLEGLNAFQKKSLFETINKTTEEYRSRKNQILKSVGRTYELRHIFCHEFATNIVVDKEEILQSYYDCKIFLDHCNNYIWETLYPNAPETQGDMIRHAHEQYEIKEKELMSLIEEIKVASPEYDTINILENDLFDQSIALWKEYRTAHANYKAKMVWGGSMHPLLHSSDLKHVTEEKIKSLEEEFAILLRRSRLK